MFTRIGLTRICDAIELTRILLGAHRAWTMRGYERWLETERRERPPQGLSICFIRLLFAVIFQGLYFAIKMLWGIFCYTKLSQFFTTYYFISKNNIQKENLQINIENVSVIGRNSFILMLLYFLDAHASFCLSHAHC